MVLTRGSDGQWLLITEDGCDELPKPPSLGWYDRVRIARLLITITAKFLKDGHP